MIDDHFTGGVGDSVRVESITEKGYDGEQMCAALLAT